MLNLPAHAIGIRKIINIGKRNIFIIIEYDNRDGKFFLYPFYTFMMFIHDNCYFINKC